MMKLNVIALRVELAKIGKTQTWLADQCGCTKQNISHIIKHRRINLLPRMSEILKINIEDLII
jgi:transcriptional regulator